MWISVHAPEVPMHPHAVLLGPAEGAARGFGLLGARVGEQVEIVGGDIVLGQRRLTIRLGRAEVWNAAQEPLKEGLRLRDTDPVGTIWELLAERETTSPFLGHAVGAATAEGALIRKCRLIRRDLAAAWRRGDAGSVSRAMRCAVGLGSGLTPSGDDFLVGFLGAAHVFAYGGGVEDGLRQALRVRRSMTTLPSYFMLRGAVAGFLPEPLSDLLRAIADESPGRVRDSAGRLAELGAASGQDMIAGVICYLEAAHAAGETE